MKNRRIKPAVFNIIKDKEDSSISLHPNTTARSMEYSTQELKAWIDEGLLPEDISKTGRQFLKSMRKELNKKKQFIANNPNPTSEDWVEWCKSNLPAFSLEKMHEEIAFIDYLLQHEDRLKESLEQVNSQTFALPSHVLMLAMLALFAGKPKRIPRHLLKHKDELSAEEKDQVAQYINNIFETHEKFDYVNEKTIITRTAFICNNPIVEGTAEIDLALFEKDLSFSETKLALFLQKTFGPEGIRHFLGIVIALEENNRKGSFDWSVNDHLERLGYHKKNGSFDPELKKTASEIIKIFAGLLITSTRKEGKNGSIKSQKILMVSGSEQKTFENKIINEKITLVAPDFWYKNAFLPKDGESPKYTKLLKKIVKENHRSYPLTLYLAPLFAIFWRINITKTEFKVKVLMDWCNLDSENKYRSENLRDLELTLEYMKKQGYLGDWSHNGASEKLTTCVFPYDCTLTLLPPDWLKNDLTLIQQKREVVGLIKKQKILGFDEFLKIFEDSGLSKQQFARSIGVTRPLIASIINKKRKITAETSNKIFKFIANLKKQNVTEPNPLSGI